MSLANSQLVDRIEITGNKKTQEATILQELLFQAGDSVTDEEIILSTQAIKDLGLFKAVVIKKNENDDGSIVANIVIEEKRFNFILPKLNRNGDGDITTGIVWRSDNLFGKNQRSKLTLAYREFEDADEDEETEIKWEYSYPRITNTPYLMSFLAIHEKTTLDETIGIDTGRFDRTRNLFRLLVGRWLTKKGPSQGLTLSVGPHWEDYEHEFISGTPGLLPDLTVQGIVGEINAYYVHDHLLSRSGHHYGYEFFSADDVTGSDINFLQHFAFYRKYIPIPKIEHSNLNLQIRLGHINRSILGPPQFKIGGSRSLRGYDRDAVEGNSFIIFNAEWLRPLFNKETLRSAVIFDAGNAWDRSNRSDAFSDFKYSAGFGLRWKIKRFVKTDVRLDIAHGFSSGGETKAYLTTRSTF